MPLKLNGCVITKWGVHLRKVGFEFHVHVQTCTKGTISQRKVHVTVIFKCSLFNYF